jgi:hypothetical protein
MDESADKSLDNNDNADFAKKFATNCADGAAARDGETAPAASSAATENKLPVVWSPKLDAADDIEAGTTGVDSDNPAGSNEEAATGAAAPEPADAAAASPPRPRRFALLAATLAIAAGLGSFIGALTASGIGRLLLPPQTAILSNNTEDSAVTKALQGQLAALSSLKAALDSAARNTSTQFAALGDRLDRVEHSQSDATARLSKLDTAPETTGSIGSSTATATEPKLTDRILQDWVVHDVRGDRALVGSRFGGLFDVGVGSVLPGVGRVDGVKRQDGEWVVVTAHGLITSGH